MINQNRTGPVSPDTILARIVRYGDQRATVHVVESLELKVKARLAAAELFAELGAMVRTGIDVDPALDAKLDAAFRTMPAEPCLTVVGTGSACDNCDGPTSGVHSNHTLTEDAACFAADLGQVDLAEICRTLGAPSGPTDVAIRAIPTAYPVHYAASGAIRAFAIEGHGPLVTYDFEAQAWSTGEPEPAAPVAVSPERVSMRRASELCRELNEFPSPGAADAHLRSQPEFARVRNTDKHGLIFDAELVDGSTITNSVNGWMWSQ